MSIEDLERRLSDAQREHTRLQMISTKLIGELAQLERRRVETVTTMRRKAEQEIADIQKKFDREIDDTRKEYERTSTLLKTNNVTLLNAERELDNLKQNEGKKHDTMSKRRII
jgi:hypothetical protein